MVISSLSTREFVHKYKKSIVIEFQEERHVLSTSPFNGGFRKDLAAVFNHDANPGAGMACSMKAATYREHMEIITRELGLDPEKTAGISTAASMENVSIKTVTFEDLTVTAIVTGGVEVNGGRVGDTAHYHERKGQFEKVTFGTINIILHIDADLPKGTMERTLVTCTEAKTAALQELMAGSNYSRGLATGSGTDGTIIICNPKSDLHLTMAGKHSKLGELIGKAVIPAVKEALFLQSGLCPEMQHSVLRRLKRFGVSEDKLWETYCGLNKESSISKPTFLHRIHSIERENNLVVLTSMVAHLIDQYDWDLLSFEEIASEIIFIFERISKSKGVDFEMNELAEHRKDQVVDDIINIFIKILALIGGTTENV
ncbi:adenosylcobinamide amidohydrolase [uncultured Ilyobacter sp.]|uniref:adenosylcobinamide amidohydrolase n=1 Tax=uncultured Ilyobacter sp. TaxID=544433 RepID=UPI0029C69A44|nr:adenosylcobinamide amidohydrolase [uncultured Ilyobacter sp.]